MVVLRFHILQPQRASNMIIHTITSAQRPDVLELFSRSSPSFQRARFLVRPVLFQSLKCLRVANVFVCYGLKRLLPCTQAQFRPQRTALIQLCWSVVMSDNSHTTGGLGALPGPQEFKEDLTKGRASSAGERLANTCKLAQMTSSTSVKCKGVTL